MRSCMLHVSQIVQNVKYFFYISTNTHLLCFMWCREAEWSFNHHQLIVNNLVLAVIWLLVHAPLYLLCVPNMTLVIKFTMADAGCSGSSSAKRWQTFSAAVPAFRATKPNTLKSESKRLVLVTETLWSKAKILIGSQPILMLGRL